MVYAGRPVGVVPGPGTMPEDADGPSTGRTPKAAGLSRTVRWRVRVRVLYIAENLGSEAAIKGRHEARGLHGMANSEKRTLHARWEAQGLALGVLQSLSQFAEQPNDDHEAEQM